MASAVVVSDDERSKIHASFFALACACVGMLGVGVGTLLSPGVGGALGWALHSLGWLLVAVAVVAHIEHLSNRLGRAAVVCGILAAVALALADAPFALNPDRVLETSWLNYYIVMWAVAPLLTAVSLTLVAMRKEKLMEQHIALGETGKFAVDDYETTVHASFLSLMSGALACLLAGIAQLMLINGAGSAAQLAWALFALASVFLAVAIISHIEHLSMSIGRAAVWLGAAAAVLNGLGCIPSFFELTNESTIGGKLTWIMWGITRLIATLALAIVAMRRRAQDSRAASA